MSKLPNRYGSIVKLSGNRSRPFMIRSGTYDYTDKGHPIFDIVGYAATREEANIILAEYNRDPWNVNTAKMTMEELFKLWEEKKAPKLGASNNSSLHSAYKHCSKLWKRPYKSIRAYEMQDTIDDCGLSYSSQGNIKNLWGHLDRFALELDIINRCYSDLLTSAPVPPTSRIPFSEAEVKTLWNHQNDPWVDTVLIFIYSGWRINELLSMKKSSVDLKEGTMTGGSKTKAGKGRTVPIHSLILPFVQSRMEAPGDYLIGYQGKRCSEPKYRRFWKNVMDDLKMEHNPHDCRHTLESLLDDAGANKKCIDMIMGHVSKDTGNRVYNHKTINDLKFNLELVQRPSEASEQPYNAF